MSLGTATGVETSNGSVSNRNGPEPADPQPQNGTTSSRRHSSLNKKYRHVAAVHLQTRPSCLSHDSDAAPSFLGFRNLMVIVLGRLSSMGEVMNSSLTTSFSGWQLAIDD